MVATASTAIHRSRRGLKEMPGVSVCGVSLSGVGGRSTIGCAALDVAAVLDHVAAVEAE